MKHFLQTILFVLCMTCANAWAQAYRPLLEEGKTWTVAGVHATWAGSPFRGYGQYNIYTLRGVDTVDGKPWRQLFCYNMDEQGNKSAESRVALLREENGKVSFYDTKDKTEKLLMDINAEKGDVLNVAERAVSRWNDEANRTLEGVSVQEVSAYNYGDNTLKKLRLKWTGEGTDESQPYEFSWVEGVGAVGQEPFNNDPAPVAATFIPRLADCQVDGDVLYRDEDIYAYMQQTLPTEFPGAEGYRPLLEEGKTWQLELSMANGQQMVYDYSACKGDVVGGIQFWSLTESCTYPDTESPAESTRKMYVGEKDGKLYFMNGGGEASPALFMDFSLTEGSSIDLENVTFDERNVRIEVTAVSDTVLANSSDKSCRRCLYVSYQTEQLPGNWAEVKRDVWVEGVGSLKYGILFPYYFGTTGGILNLLKCHAKDIILYKAPGNPNGISSPSMVNGQCSMLHDLQGRRLTAEPQSGVFIRDGKKVMR